MNEEQLIAGCQKQDRIAQKALYEKYSRLLFGICLRYCPDVSSAQDLLQDGFIKVFTSIQSFQGKGSFEGWLKRIFVNLALENIRKDKKILQFTDDIQNYSDSNELTDDDDISLIPEKELLNMIQELPKGYAAVFNLYAIEDYSHKEIAELLNINESTSRSQYVRARQILQQRVKQYIKDNN
ncbi:RNA polymerase sigma factor [Dysgonomonas massiliensis]|uniref:RNA polymerase sigma factor n=1 Tax=Dysgonomonas massiliensis TaxID=2040292 RepID=UPI000C77583B|nr:sigma-70 family RNA polymerase sigma factor [Dysgonomonas massiliensis]